MISISNKTNLKHISNIGIKMFLYIIPYLLLLFIFLIFNYFITKGITSQISSLIIRHSGLDYLGFGNFLKSLNFITFWLYIILFIVIGGALYLQFAVTIYLFYYLQESFYTREDMSFKFPKFSNIYTMFKNINIPILFFASIYYIGIVSMSGIPIFNSLFGSIEYTNSLLKVVFSNNLYMIIFFSFIAIGVYLAYRFSMVTVIFVLGEDTFLETLKKNTFIVKKYRFYLIILFLILFLMGITGILFDVFIAEEVFYTILINPTDFGFIEVLWFIIYLIFQIIYYLMPMLLFSVLIYLYKLEFGDLKKDVEYNEFGYKKPRTFKISYITATLILSIIFVTLNANMIPYGDTYQSEIMVHRAGGNEAPENSLDGISYSIDNGYPWVEIDIIETKDQELVLVHDVNLYRLTGEDLNVYELTLEEMQELTLIDPKTGEDTGISFITLDEALTYADGNINFNIELKFHGHESDEFLNNVIDTIIAHDMVDKSYVSSFNYQALKEIEDIDSNINTMLFTFYFFSDVYFVQTDAIGMDIKYINPYQAQKITSSGKELAIYTVNSNYEMFDVFRYNPDYIITDEPQRLKEIQEASYRSEYISR